MEKEIDPTKRYKFPCPLKTIRYRGKIIVVSSSSSNWIVLESEMQYSFFKLLQEYSIEESIQRFEGTQDVVSYVLMQIEARHLESTDICRKTYSHMQLYLTNSCNMRCPHCYMYAGEKFEDELSTAEIISLLGKFKESGGDRVIFTGGEIGMRKDLRQILFYSHNIDLLIEILTNGTLFGDAFIDEISSIVDRVQISIDGYSEASNAKIRGAGNFQRALKTVDRFIKNGKKVEIAITPFPSDELEAEAKGYVEFAQELLRKYQEKIVIKFTTGIFEGRNIDLKKVDIDKYNRIVSAIIEDVYGVDDSFSGFVIAARKQVVNDNCAYGALNISANGDVFPCAKLFSVGKIANIRTTEWSEIFSMSNELKTKSNISNLEPCRNCELLYICGGGCRLDYFEQFKKPKELLGANRISQRKECEERNRILDLLIDTNELIFQ